MANLMEQENAGNVSIGGPAYNKGQQGVFALHPLMTPKYALGKPRDNEFKETLARMYVSLAAASDPIKKAYLKALPQEDRVQALAQVLIGKGQKTQTGFIDFFLLQVNENFQEVAQVDKVLGDNYVAFYFGQEPPMFQYSGMLLNSQQDDQRTGFALAYQHILRGTQLARRSALVRLRYDSVIVSGTLHATSQTINAENELAVPFNFTLLVKEYVCLQNMPHVKLKPEQFVQLSTAFADAAFMGGVGQAADVRVRTTSLVSQSLDESGDGEGESEGENVPPPEVPTSGAPGSEMTCTPLEGQQTLLNEAQCVADANTGNTDIVRGGDPSAALAAAGAATANSFTTYTEREMPIIAGNY